MMPAPTRLRRCLVLALLALAAALLPPRAGADDKLRQSDVIWRAVDSCTRAAVKAYPDYTAEALAKREVQRRLCLRRNNLPGGDDLPAAPAATGGDVSK